MCFPQPKLFPHHRQTRVESLTMRARAPGRSWTAPELRLKSFTELHQLWYILLRERNVLLTQREEARRLRVDLSGYTAVPDKLRLVRLCAPFLSEILGR